MVFRRQLSELCCLPAPQTRLSRSLLYSALLVSSKNCARGLFETTAKNWETSEEFIVSFAHRSHPDVQTCRGCFLSKGAIVCVCTHNIHILKRPPSLRGNRKPHSVHHAPFRLVCDNSRSEFCSNGMPGIQTGLSCCEVACGRCGGTGCDLFGGGLGEHSCCDDTIETENKLCSNTGAAPCVVEGEKFGLVTAPAIGRCHETAHGWAR